MEDTGLIEEGPWRVSWDHTHNGLLTYELDDLEEGYCHTALHEDGDWRVRPSHTNTVDHERLLSRNDPDYAEVIAILDKARARAWGS